MEVGGNVLSDEFQYSDAVICKTWQNQVADDDAAAGDATIVCVQRGAHLINHGFE